MTLSTTTTTDPYVRALDAEPHLRAAESLVDLVGWGRREGYETEPWLRTSEAFDVVTDRWLAMLDDADPGNGHGMGRGTDEGTLPCCS